MGSCSLSGLTLSAVGGVGLDGFHISGVASGQPRCRGGFRRDDGCQLIPILLLRRYSDSPLVWVTQKPRGGSPGPQSAGVYIGDGCCQ